MTWPAAVCAPLLERGSLVLEVRMSRTTHVNAPRDVPHETRYSGIHGVDEGSLAQPAQASHLYRQSTVQKHSGAWHVMLGSAQGFISTTWAVGVDTVTTQGA